jgi:hypothetical protein
VSAYLVGARQCVVRGFAPTRHIEEGFDDVMCKLFKHGFPDQWRQHLTHAWEAVKVRTACERLLV